MRAVHSLFVGTGRLSIIAFLACWIVFVVFPLYWTVSTSLKQSSDVALMPPNFLFSPDYSNYKIVLWGNVGDSNQIEQEGFGRYLRNSLTVSVIATILVLCLSSMVSYYLSRARMRSEGLLNWILSFRMMPPVAVVIPFYCMMNYLRLVDSIFALILAYIALNMPLAIWIICTYMYSIPRRYDEMAMVDGFSHWSIFFRIILPLSRPAILTAGLIVFIFCWNEFLFALVLTGFQAKTLPVMATGFITQRGILWGQLTATAVLITLPVVLLAAALHENFAKGMTFGLTKR